MNDRALEWLSDAIDDASQLAAAGFDDAAALSFALTRRLLVSMSDASALEHRVDNHVAPLTQEREQYRALIRGERSGDRQLVVLSDSLGLPRPEDKGSECFGAESTYPFLLLDRLPTYEVESHCQRYFTTGDVVAVLHDTPSLGMEADVVIHVGLNDCANRIFLETERLALDLIPADMKDRIVTFGQRHRRMLLRHLPPRHYVDPDQFRANLDTAFELLRRRQARRVIVATIILPPAPFWAATPGIQGNFARYNWILMDAASRHGGVLLDIDRHVWSRLQEGVLLSDGMHLSLAGHHLFADELATILA